MRSDGIDWDLVWTRTCDTLIQHMSDGFGHLLTEDSVRFATILALAAQGLTGSALTVEAPLPQLGNGQLDLVAQFDDGHALFEFSTHAAREAPSPPTP